MRFTPVFDRICLLSFVMATLSVLTCTTLVGAQVSAPNAADLVKGVITNELNDRVERRKWMYTVEKHENRQDLTEVQVETPSGPLKRLLAINCQPIDSARRHSVRICRRRVTASMVS